MEVKVGDPITMVDMLTPVWLNVVGSPGASITATYVVAGLAHTFNFAVDGEGITWIRGHHGPESETLRALQAAWLLRNV
jgi:hypothetical protein